MYTLYGYWRSTAAYRVRIALNYLAIEHQHASVHLVNNGGEQHSEEYSKLNASHLVPTLVDNSSDQAIAINQSMAIIEYLAEQQGDQSLIGETPAKRAIIRSLSQDICCDIHPINNLRVIQHLDTAADFSSDDKASWMKHWMKLGFVSLEKKLQQYAGDYCIGDTVTLVDLCLIPQLYNAHRFGLSLTQFPLLSAIEQRCLSLSAFEQAIPENQPDAI